jgi:hypothetical protein
MKNRRDRTQPGAGVELPSQTPRPSSPTSNLEFVRAFADALRDILRDERVRIHG